MEDATFETAKKAILSNYLELNGQPTDFSTFCVDGRMGSRINFSHNNLGGPYLQTLGGSYHQVALRWILNGGKEEFVNTARSTFNDLRNLGYEIGVHTGHHADSQKQSSDCGFADNLGLIMTAFGQRSDEIWMILTDSVPSLVKEKDAWLNLAELVRKSDTSKIQKGESLIDLASVEFKADKQNLEGEHKEIAAVVNLISQTTLDVDNNQQTQAFNLDLWHAVNQSEALGIEAQKAKLLSLGLYVATEMILVEAKGKPRLPIIIRN